MAALTREQSEKIHKVLRKYHNREADYAENTLEKFIDKMSISGVTSTWVKLAHGSDILITGMDCKVLVQKYALIAEDQETFDKMSQELESISIN